LEERRVSEKPMTEEEYLRARGWTMQHHTTVMWSHDRRPPEQYASTNWSTTAEAVAAQLEEDRRIYNFVRARSVMCGTMLREPPDWS
jgi:hypothetical protein